METYLTCGKPVLQLGERILNFLRRFNGIVEVQSIQLSSLVNNCLDGGRDVVAYPVPPIVRLRVRSIPKSHDRTCGGERHIECFGVIHAKSRSEKATVRAFGESAFRQKRQGCRDPTTCNHYSTVFCARSIRSYLVDKLYCIRHYVIKRKQLEIFVRGRGIPKRLARSEVSMLKADSQTTQLLCPFIQNSRILCTRCVSANIWRENRSYCTIQNIRLFPLEKQYGTSGLEELGFYRESLLKSSIIEAEVIDVLSNEIIIA